METLATELAFANNATAQLLETVNLIDRRLLALEKETLPIRRLTETLHTAQTNITSVLDQFGGISSHFAVADGPSSSSFDADMLFRCSESIAYLNDHRQFQSTSETLERLLKLQARGRQSGCETLERLLSSDDADRLMEARETVKVKSVLARTIALSPFVLSPLSETRPSTGSPGHGRRFGAYRDSRGSSRQKNAE
jgi:hypothetical protein